MGTGFMPRVAHPTNYEDDGRIKSGWNTPDLEITSQAPQGCILTLEGHVLLRCLRVTSTHRIKCLYHTASSPS